MGGEATGSRDILRARANELILIGSDDLLDVVARAILGTMRRAIAKMMRDYVIKGVGIINRFNLKDS